MPSENKSPDLSYSSMKLLQSCEQAYYFHKVDKVEPDSDYVDGDALGLGKAFHQAMENTMHKKYVKELLIQAMEDHKVDAEDFPMLEAMCRKYVELHKLSGLTVVKCELQVNIPGRFIGFIDMIMKNEDDGTWWIGDLKTARTLDKNLLPRLPKDPQLNLYTRFYKEICGHFDLDPNKFMGCRYRCITKPSLKMKGKETVTEYIERLMDSCEVYDIEIPFAMMDIKIIWELHSDAHERATQLHNGEAPKKNYNNCISYFKACKNFSRCHGFEFSTGSNRVKVHTINSFTEAEDSL